MKKTKKRSVRRIKHKATTPRRANAVYKTPKVPASRHVRVHKIDAALRRFDTASRAAHARAEELAALSHAIAHAAVEKNNVIVIAEWAQMHFLRDLLAMREAFAQSPIGSLSKSMESLRLLPGAMIQWLDKHFNLVPVGIPGNIMEVPSSRLVNYSYEFEAPRDPTALVIIRIVSPGWKRNDKLIIPPRIELHHNEPDA